MQTSLRKMGNSTGLIVPRTLLGEIGVTTGAAMDLRVENGTLIATPIETPVRHGWADAAAALTDERHDDWQAFGNEDDALLAW